tara:strand:- start:3465 stop:4310 length:846 start_codon:yes stop_codon:yes gene_type:complete
MTDNVETAPTEQPSPNDNWTEDSRLDSNGNPLEVAPVEEVVEPVTEEPKEEPTEETPSEDEPAVLDETEVVTESPKFDSSAAEQVRSFLTDAGLVPADVAAAVTENNGEVTPEILKALVEKHGEGVASLIKDKLTNLHQSNVTASKAADSKIFTQVEKAFEGMTKQSGSDTFKELATWAKDNMSTADRGDINKLLAQGGKAAELAVNSLVQSFKQSDSFVSTPAKLLVADDTTSEYGGKPLDKAGYDRQLRKLMNEGHDYDTSPEIASLNSRRSKSLKRGN